MASGSPRMVHLSRTWIARARRCPRRVAHRADSGLAAVVIVSGCGMRFDLPKVDDVVFSQHSARLLTETLGFECRIGTGCVALHVAKRPVRRMPGLPL